MIAAIAGLAGFVATPTWAGMDFDQKTVRAGCETDWPGDFTMVAVCLDQHRAAAERLSQIEPKLDTAMQNSLAACRQKWGDDWAMTVYCLEQQIAGRVALAALFSDLPSEIIAQVQDTCAADWPGDYDMMAYCAEQQTHAWKELNN